MLRTVQIPCSLPKSEADELNTESGRIYTDMLVSHYRLYRKQESGSPARMENAGKISMEVPPPFTLTAAMPPNRVSTKLVRGREPVDRWAWRSSIPTNGSAGEPPSGKA